MLAREFIASLLPGEGLYALGIIKPETKKFRVQFFNDLDVLCSTAENVNGSGEDVYVALFSFGSKSRQANNAVNVRSFFLDLDVGTEPNKFQTKKEAAKELQRFVVESGLPTPTVIDSGGGFHVYWRLTEDIGRQQWFPLAVRLKALCKKFNFRVDHSVTSDAARVLRIVGSINHKRGVQSKMVIDGGEIALDQFVEVLDAHAPEESWLRSAKKDWMKTSNLASSEYDPNIEFRFKKIFDAAIKHNQCPQILYCIEHPENTAEPLWRAALSIAWHCEDSEKAIHVISMGHPEYDPDRTIAKAMGTEGKPHRCETFDNISPGLCETCPNYNKLNSPIALGKNIKHSAPASVMTNTTSLVHAVQVPIPVNLPSPFFRPATGGIAIDTEDKKGCPKQVILTSSDIWIDNLVQDQRKEYRASLCINHPQDGFRACAVSFAELSSKDSAIKFLAAKGVSIDPSCKDLFMQYIHKIIRNLQVNKPSVIARDNFGWTPDGTFVIGEIEHVPKHKGMVIAAAASQQTEALRPMYIPSGSLSVWKAAMKSYIRGGHDMAPLRYGAIYTQFGAPLMRFTSQNAVVNSMLGPSGVGKTTAQLLGMSVFCSRTAKIQGTSTMNAIFNRIGVLNNLPFVIDEFSEEDDRKQAAITLNITSGSGKDRMEGSTNTERINTIRWASQGSLSTNRSLHDLLSDKPQNLMRVFEFTCPKSKALTSREVDNMLAFTKENYGWAGFVYLQYLVNNFDRLQSAVDRVVDAVTRHFDMRQEERFWTSGIATNLIGAILFKRLGLFDSPLKNDLVWIALNLRNLRESSTEVQTPDRVDPFGLFIRHNMRSIARMTKNMHNELVPLDVDRLTAPIVGKYDMDAKVIWLSYTDVQDFFKDSHPAYRTALARFKRILVDHDLLGNLMNGLSSKPVPCYRIPLDDPDIRKRLGLASSS